MMLLYQIFVQQYTLVYEKFVFVELTTTFNGALFSLLVLDDDDDEAVAILR